MDMLRGGFMPGLLGNGGGGVAAVFATASLDLDLTNTATGSQLTTTRAGVAYADDTSGVWTQFAANAPRITNKGLLVEEARTNSIRNNSMQGAVPGTPGTLPTNWTMALAGTAQTIVGVGVENGIDYIDIRCVGTTNSTEIVVVLSASNHAAAVQGQAWTQSGFLALVGGSLTNVTQTQFSLVERDSGFASLTVQNSAVSISSSLARYSGLFTVAQAAAAFIQPRVRFVVNNAAAVDFTIRIGWPQLELGAFVTSPIRTTTVAVTRAADTVALGDSTIIPGSAPVTLFAQVSPFGSFANNTAAGIPFGWSRIAGFTDVEYLTIAGGTGAMGVGCIAATVSTLASNVGNATTSRVKMAVAIAADDGQGCYNGVLAPSDATVTIPIGPSSKISIGSAPWTASNWLNGYVERVAYWNTRLTNAQLQQITA